MSPYSAARVSTAASRFRGCHRMIRKPCLMADRRDESKRIRDLVSAPHGAVCAGYSCDRRMAQRSSLIADQVARDRGRRSLAHPVRLLGRLLDDVGAAGLQPCEDASMTDQSSGRAAKSFFVFLYHPIPDTGCFHLSCMLLRALLCVSSPLATISFRWLSWAFMTSSALFPWNGAPHGPPICLQVIVFIFITRF